MYYFWLVLFYSFAGYLLEKLFAYVTRAQHRVRKCCLLLPLCPVYGLAMLAVAEITRGAENPYSYDYELKVFHAVMKASGYTGK